MLNTAIFFMIYLFIPVNIRLECRTICLGEGKLCIQIRTTQPKNTLYRILPVAVRLIKYNDNSDFELGFG